MLEQGDEHKPKRRQIFLGVAITLILVVASGIGAIVLSRRSPFPKQITNAQQSAIFPLYYPSSLPHGYTFNASNISVSNKVVVYQINTPDNRKLLFSIEPKPQDYDFNTFEYRTMDDSEDVTSAFGQGVVGLYNNVATGSFVTGQSWILVTAPGGVKTVDFKQILQDLRPVQI